MKQEEILMRIRRLLHELGQPLTAAIGLAYIISFELEENIQIKNNLIILSEQLEKINQIIKHIQDTVRTANPDKFKLDSFE